MNELENEIEKIIKSALPQRVLTLKQAWQIYNKHQQLVLESQKQTERVRQIKNIEIDKAFKQRESQKANT